MIGKHIERKSDRIRKNQHEKKKKRRKKKTWHDSVLPALSSAEFLEAGFCGEQEGEKKKR